MRDCLPPKIQADSAGFSLIETMVASIILGMAITGVMSMLSMGSALESEGSLKRQAGMIASSALEGSEYQSWNYKDLNLPPPDAPVTLKTSQGADIPATLKIAITPVTVLMIDLDGGVDIPVNMKAVKSTVEWTFAENLESVSFEKSITDLK